MGKYGGQRQLPPRTDFSRLRQRVSDSGFVPVHELVDKRTRRPVSRVLSALACGTTIPLGRTSRCASRDQPERQGGNAPAPRGAVVPIRSCSRWGLPCRPCCQGRGALLPPRFALARGPSRDACAGGVISVALSLGSPPPAVSRHRIPVEPGLSSAGVAAGGGRPAV